MNDRRERNSPGPVRIIILIVALGVLIYSARQLYLLYSEYKAAGDEYSSLSDSFTKPFSSPGSSGSAKEDTADGGTGDTSPSGGQTTGSAAEPGGQASGTVSGEPGNMSPSGEQTTGSAAGVTAGTSVSGEQTADSESFAQQVQSESPASKTDDKKKQQGTQASSPVKADTSPLKTDTGDEVYEDADPPLEIDWEELRKINEDIVGWIYIDALPDISYPILRGRDNDYYLHHTARREYLFSGSIFEDYHNSPDFSDPSTIVYGHNMKDGSMFASLKKMNDQKIVDADPYFWILTPAGNYRYRIYSVMTTSVSSDVYLLHSYNGSEFLEWEKKMLSLSSVKSDVKLLETDKTVVLSTCTSDSSMREVVIGKCVSGIRPAAIPTPVPTPTPIVKPLPTPDPRDNVIRDGIDELYEDAVMIGAANNDVYYGETY